MKRNDIFGMVIAAVVFVILVIPIHFDLIVSSIIAVGLYFAFSYLLKPKEKIGSVDIDSIQNGEKLKGEFDNAKDDIEKIGAYGRDSGDFDIEKGTIALSKTGNDIMTYLSEHIDRVPKAKRFLNYYLDTAVEILKKYASLKKNNAPADEMERVTGETKEAIKTLYAAFNDQYKRLLAGDVMDIETDIKVLRDSSKMDGVNDEV